MQAQNKVCIVTWYSSTNCGTCLQARALYEMVSKKYDVCMLSYKRQYSILSIHDWPIVIRKIQKKLLEKNRVANADALEVTSERTDRINSFVKDSFSLLTLPSGKKQRLVEDQIACFLVGSDQLWNPYWYDDTYYLDFVNNNKKKKSYATSIGISSLPVQKEKKMKKRLQSFSDITVREETAKNILTKLLKRDDILVVADPTFLLTANDWRSIYRGRSKIAEDKKNYILCYFVGGLLSHKQEIQTIADQLKLKVIIIPMHKSDYNYQNGIFQEAGPYEFLDLIDHAKYVCTDSFHAIAISLSMSKNFITMDRLSTALGTSQRSRIDELLVKYNLEKQKYSMSQCIDEIAKYDEIQEKLQREREYSINMLYGMLEEVK